MPWWLIKKRKSTELLGSWGRMQGEAKTETCLDSKMKKGNSSPEANLGCWLQTRARYWQFKAICLLKSHHLFSSCNYICTDGNTKKVEVCFLILLYEFCLAVWAAALCPPVPPRELQCSSCFFVRCQRGVWIFRSRSQKLHFIISSTPAHVARPLPRLFMHKLKRKDV